MTVDLSSVHDRRRLIVELLRTEIISSVKQLREAIETRTGQRGPGERTLQSDLEAIGAVRVPLGRGEWRYRTPDLITIDDVRLSLQDRLAADGLSCALFTDGIVVRTTKGVSGSVAGLFKMLMDHHLDDSIQWVMHDQDDTVMVGVQPRDARAAYQRTVEAWMGKA